MAERSLDRFVVVSGMKRIITQVGIFLGLYVLVGLLRYPYTALPYRISEYAQSTAKQAAVELEIVDPTITFPFKLAAKGLRTSFATPLGPLAIHTQNLRCSPSLWSLLRFTLASDCNLQAYNGRLAASATRSLFSEQVSLESTFQDLELSSLELLQPYAISGLLDVIWRGTVNPADATANGTISLTVEQGGYAGNQKLMGLIDIPTIKDIAGTIEASIKEREVQVHKAELYSSLGNATAVGTGKLTSDFTLDAYQAEIQLALSAEGKRQFGAYLALGASGRGNAAAEQWQISIEKQSGQALPQVRTKALN